MPLSPNSNVLSQLHVLRDNADWTRKQYEQNYMTEPTFDRDGWWDALFRDFDGLPDEDLRQLFCNVLRPHIVPRPATIEKCRSTLVRITENIRTLIHHLTPLLAPDADLRSPVTFQSSEMKETDIITPLGNAGPVLQIENAAYGHAKVTMSVFDDPIADIRKNRQRPSGQRQPDPFAARVIKRSGNVVGYHVESFCIEHHQDVARIIRIGAAPLQTEHGVHSALIYDILAAIDRRFPFRQDVDKGTEKETTLAKIE